MDNERVILKKLREVNGFTIRQAAKQIGRSPSWLSETERGIRKCALSIKDKEKLMQLYNATKYQKQFGGWLASAKKEANKSKKIPSYSFDGAIYKYLRIKKAKMTLKKAAKHLKVSISYLSMLESGKRISTKEMKEKILNLYGYNVSSFKNFTTPGKRGNNIPKKYKLNILLNSLTDDHINKIFEFVCNFK